MQLLPGERRPLRAAGAVLRLRDGRKGRLLEPLHGRERRDRRRQALCRDRLSVEGRGEALRGRRAGAVHAEGAHPRLGGGETGAERPLRPGGPGEGVRRRALRERLAGSGASRCGRLRGARRGQGGRRGGSFAADGREAHSRAREGGGRPRASRRGARPDPLLRGGGGQCGRAADARLPADATFAVEEFAIGDRKFPALRASNGLLLVPYCLWGNRKPGNEMQTWFLEK